jgi:hypothetical protein
VERRRRGGDQVGEVGDVVVPAAAPADAGAGHAVGFRPRATSPGPTRGNARCTARNGKVPTRAAVAVQDVEGCRVRPLASERSAIDADVAPAASF